MISQEVKVIKIKKHNLLSEFYVCVEIELSVYQKQISIISAYLSINGYMYASIHHIQLSMFL